MGPFNLGRPSIFELAQGARGTVPLRKGERVEATETTEPIPEQVYAQLMARAKGMPSIQKQEQSTEDLGNLLAKLGQLPVETDFSPAAGFLKGVMGRDIGYKSPESATDVIKNRAGLQKLIGDSAEGETQAILNAIKGGMQQRKLTIGESVGDVQVGRDKEKSVSDSNVRKYTEKALPVIDAIESIKNIRSTLNKYPSSPGLGTFEGAIPTGLIPFAERLGAVDKGALEIRSSVTNLANKVNKALNSARATDRDFDRAKVGLGLIEKGGPENIENGLAILEEVTDIARQAIEAGYSDEEIGTARQRLEGRKGTAPGIIPMKSTQDKPKKSSNQDLMDLVKQERARRAKKK